jgi:hypothetical protein
MHDFVLQRNSDDSSSALDEDDVDLLLDQLPLKVQRNKDNKKWESEVDMLVEFEKDPELRMKAICALYRHQRFDKSDALRYE